MVLQADHPLPAAVAVKDVDQLAVESYVVERPDARDLVLVPSAEGRLERDTGRRLEAVGIGVS